MGKFILVIVLVTLTIYLAVWLIDTRGAIFRRARRNGHGGPSGRPTPRPRGPLGPDDDPEFLRDLNRKPRKGDPDS